MYAFHTPPSRPVVYIRALVPAELLQKNDDVILPEDGKVMWRRHWHRFSGKTENRAIPVQCCGDIADEEDRGRAREFRWQGPSCHLRRSHAAALVRLLLSAFGTGGEVTVPNLREMSGYCDASSCSAKFPILQDLDPRHIPLCCIHQSACDSSCRNGSPSRRRENAQELAELFTQAGDHPLPEKEGWPSDGDRSKAYRCNSCLYLAFYAVVEDPRSR
jgi:hypothetical protein